MKVVVELGAVDLLEGVAETERTVGALAGGAMDGSPLVEGVWECHDRDAERVLRHVELVLHPPREFEAAGFRAAVE